LIVPRKKQPEMRAYRLKGDLLTEMGLPGCVVNDLAEIVALSACNA
jgi:hypothetical protein